MSQQLPTPGLNRIAHATDFSPQSLVAFQHALALAVAARCKLDIVHVHALGSPDDWDAFPRVRQTLADWELLESAARFEEIEARLGMSVTKAEIGNDDPAQGLSEFLAAHRPDLLVISTHGREGLNRVLAGSVSQEVVRHVRVPTLLIGPQARPMVDPETGIVRLGSVLLPLADHPSPNFALKALSRMLEPVGLKLAAIDAITVGLELPDLIAADGHAVPVRELSGGVVDTILGIATETPSDLIVMPTTGKHGFLDELRGSTTQRVVAAAPCPVLTLPLDETAA
jgi:nucleotide-binding universal stress UspA family protein